MSSATVFLSSNPPFSLPICCSKPSTRFLSINPTTFLCSSTADHNATTPENNSSHDSLSSEPLSQPNAGATIKAPTAPWMIGPLLLQPSQVLDLSNPKKNRNRTKSPDRSLTDKVRGGRGRKAVKKISQGICKLPKIETLEQTQQNPEMVGKFSLENIWAEEDNEVESSDETWKSFEKIELDSLLGEVREDESSESRRKMPWENEAKSVFRRTKKKVVTAAEISLDGALLERLRGKAAKMRKWVKVKKAGVTQAVVDEIHFTWRNQELAMLKFDLPLCRNMERAREIVEFKTGGLVVWSKKDVLVIYRGCHYESGTGTFSVTLGGHQNSFIDTNCEDKDANSQLQSNGNNADQLMNGEDDEQETMPIVRSLYEREADRLLDGLGPRFIDWWYPKPFPVDADLLPEIIPGFKPPFRLCPPNTRSKLTDDELTYFRKLARPLPIHFVLGKNRNLQGLAAAILRLWEKCHVAKIAVKWGIPNTNNEEMANELKSLTGGVLLLRNKFFIILYRGKDFVPCGVAKLVADREIHLKSLQLHEEAARLKATEPDMMDEMSAQASKIGTFSEFQHIQSKCGEAEYRNREFVQLEAERLRLERELKNQERKLFIFNEKIKRSSKELLKLNSAWRATGQDADREMISQEERECLRKMGLKMDRCLVLGRRGVFDGVIEGLHQHWKHREIVKVITLQKVFAQVIHTAKLLEAESNGILVSIEKLKEGHAIIIYRGKNYRRPSKMAQENLLTKRKALCRSLEMQRLGSLKFFVSRRQQTVFDLKCKLVELQEKINKLLSDKPARQEPVVY